MSGATKIYDPQISMVIDSDHDYNCAWSEQLKPLGEGPWEKESFDTWWARSKELVGHLHPMIAEQWIYRHWKESPYCYLPIERLNWRQEEWDFAALQNAFIRPEFGQINMENAKHDYEYFHTKEYEDREPYKSLNAVGTWNYPMCSYTRPMEFGQTVRQRKTNFA
jgi:hypothetical protein